MYQNRAEAVMGSGPKSVLGVRPASHQSFPSCRKKQARIYRIELYIYNVVLAARQRDFVFVVH